MTYHPPGSEDEPPLAWILFIGMSMLVLFGIVSIAMVLASTWLWRHL